MSVSGIIALLVIVTLVKDEVKVKAATLREELSDVKSRLEQLEHKVGFTVDYGQKPYKHVILGGSGPIAFDNVITNVGGGYDSDSGLFTAPYPGLYIFHLHFLGGSHNETTQLTIAKNGVPVAVALAEGYHADPHEQGSATTVLRLLRGDNVSVRFHYGFPLVWGSPAFSFSGALIHAE